MKTWKTFTLLSFFSLASPSFAEFGIDPWLKGTRLFAIGESAHGSSAYTKIQHQLVQYLVIKKGFRVLILENPVLQTFPLREALLKCNGAPAPTTAFARPNEELLSMLNWICEFNRSHPRDPVMVRGNDIWDRPWDHQTLAEKYNSAFRLGLESHLKIARARCWVHNVKNWDEGMVLLQKIYELKQIPAEDFKPCMQAQATMIHQIKEEIKRATEPRRHFALHTLLQTLQTTQAWQNVWNLIYRDNDRAWSYRDQAQAQNILSFMAQEGRNKKAILISHIVHTTRQKSSADWQGMTKNRSTGYFLDQVLGRAYQGIALSGYRVDGEVEKFKLPTAPDSMDLVLHQKGVKLELVDSNGKFARSKERWFIHNENSETYPNGVFLVPRDHFEGILFVDESLQAKPILPWRSPFYP